MNANDDGVFSIDDKYASQGKLGAAIIGSHSAYDVCIHFKVFVIMYYYNMQCRKTFHMF